jgi:hypothetical protein
MFGIGIGVGIGRQRFASGIFSAYAARVAADGGVTEAGACVDAVSTLLQTASLLLVPSGYKSGKVYLQIPTNGNGDLTFTRASTAIRTNSTGLLESMATGVPRLSYMYGSCPALLLEPQRSNLALSSDDLTNATYWTVLATRFTSSTTTSILGANNAFIFTEAIASDTHNVFAASANRPTSTSGATYTISAYFKQGTRRYAGITVGSGGSGIHVFLDTTTWAITDAKRFGVNTNWVYLSSQIVLSPNSGGWYRLSVTFRTDAALTLIPSIFASNVSTSASSEPTYLGDGSTIICGQIQVELGAYPTTYIPTTTATVTRITDAFTRNNIFTNGLITSSGGTWFLELRNNVVYTRDTIGAIWIGDNSTAASLGNSLNIRSSGTGLLPINKCVGGTLTGLYTTLTSTVKIAIKWNGTTADVFVNGTKVVSATAFTTTNMEFLCGQGSDVPKFIQQMALYPTPLSDTDCIALTTL